MLTHPGILISFESQRLTQDSSTATLWKDASSRFPAYTDVLIELFSLSPLIAGIITGTLEWAVQAGHRLSIVRLGQHWLEIGGVWTGVYRRRIRPEGGRTGAALFESPQGGLFPEAPPGEGRAQAVDQVPREASSLKLLREKVNPQKSSQDSRCGNPTQR